MALPDFSRTLRAVDAGFKQHSAIAGRDDWTASFVAERKTMPAIARTPAATAGFALNAPHAG